MKVRIPLVVKYTAFLVLFTGAIVGGIGAIMLRHERDVLQTQLIEHGKALANTLERQATDPILTHDDLMLAIQVKEMMKNSGIVEAFIVDRDGRIKAHSDTYRCQQSYRAPPSAHALSESDVPIQIYPLMEWDLMPGVAAAASALAAGGSPPADRLYTFVGEPLARATEAETKLYRPGPVIEVFDISPPILLPGKASGPDANQAIATLHLCLSKEVLDEAIRAGTRRIVEILVGVLFLAILVAVISVRTMVKPIRLLVGGVHAIAGGNLNQEILLKRRDELGTLTDAFNEMVRSLREKEFYKSTLGRYVSKQVVDELKRDPTKLSLGGTRRRAAVLFADIRGFTAMSERLKPEEVVGIINAYFEALTEAIFRHDGTLDKFIGDCIMAVFGAPIARPDDAERAVRAALEMQARVARINRERATEGKGTVSIGIGINTGEVVAGNMGSSERMDYTVIGDHVNLAARLESNAEGGQILVSESTYQEVKDLFLFERLDALRVKGKSTPVEVFAVKGIRDVAVRPA